MSFSETAYQDWVQSQLEPGQRILSYGGSGGRKNPVFMEKRIAMDRLREEMGDEEYERWNKEFNEWELHSYKEDHDL